MFQPVAGAARANNVNKGIGLRWLDAGTLDVALPACIRLESKRTQDLYLGKTLTYEYRTLQSEEPGVFWLQPQRF